MRRPLTFDTLLHTLGTRGSSRSTLVASTTGAVAFVTRLTAAATQIRFRSVLRLAVCLSATFLCPACGSDTILIGEYGSHSGSTATFGVSTQNGILLAIKEANDRIENANKKDGGNRKKFAVISIDDHGLEDDAEKAVKSLIDQGVVAILGDIASSLTLKTASQADEAKIPMITPGSTAPTVTRDHPYLFRACFNDTLQGRKLAEFVKTRPELAKIAVLLNPDDAYSREFAAAFRENLGRPPVIEEVYHQGDLNFRRQLESIKAFEPDAIFVPGYYAEAALIGGQLVQVFEERKGEKPIKRPILIGGDGWDSGLLLTIGNGRGLAGAFFTSHSPVLADGGWKNPTTDSFKSAYRATFKVEPDSFAALGYDAATILIDAEKRRSEGQESLLTEIANTDGTFITGRIKFPEEHNDKTKHIHDPMKSVFVLNIERDASADDSDSRGAKIVLHVEMPPAK